MDGFFGPIAEMGSAPIVMVSRKELPKKRGRPSAKEKEAKKRRLNSFQIGDRVSPGKMESLMARWSI